MTQSKLSVAIVGAGIGGLTAAALLRQIGADVQVYEQAQRFTRLGAGIQMSPNPMRVLRRLGLEERLRAASFLPASMINREHDTGKLTFDYPLGAGAEARYGAPYLLLHRGDLHAAIAAVVPESIVHLQKKLRRIANDGQRVRLDFEDGTMAEADFVIGADGVHSLVREYLLGADQPRYTGRVAYRTTFPAHLLQGVKIEECTKWWGPDRHIVIYPVTSNMDEIYFVTSTPEPESRLESWSAKGDMDELRAAYASFHPTVRAVLNAAPEAHKWALVERDPLARWHDGRIALLGDSCHPMTPYMAQGASSAMEDSAILMRCLNGVDGTDSAALRHALDVYEATRKPRASQIQYNSHLNTWMHRKTDPDWVYGYDVWSAPLADPAAAAVAA